MGQSVNMIRKQWITDSVWVITLVMFSAVYHGIAFILTLILSSAAGRILASIVFDSLRIHWLSKFYFDVLVIITIFPYILNDVIMRVESRFRFLKHELWEDASLAAKAGFSIIQALGVAYLLGTSYGLVITIFGERLEASVDAETLESPIVSVLIALRKTLLQGWNVQDQIKGDPSGSEEIIYLEFIFLISSLFPIYCTVRCFRNYGKEDSAVNMRIHFWNFLWSCLTCCGKDSWQIRRCVMYFLAFVYEILQCGFFVILPLALSVLIGRNLMSIAAFGKCAVLYSVFASGTLLVTEDMILNQTMLNFLKQNIQARHLASVLLLYLTSIPVFIMFFITSHQDVLDSVFLTRKMQMLMCISSVAYCAYGCSKVTISKAAAICASLTAIYFEGDHKSSELNCDGNSKPSFANSERKDRILEIMVPTYEKYHLLSNEEDKDDQLIIP